MNGQLRQQEFFIENNIVHIFDSDGDQLGFRFTSDELATSLEGGGSSDTMAKAPMPGTITKVFQKVGSKLKKGESIIAMEAMKM